MRVNRPQVHRPPHLAHLWLSQWLPEQQVACPCLWPSPPVRQQEGPRWWPHVAPPMGQGKGQAPMVAQQGAMWSKGVTCWAAAAAAEGQLATLRTTHTPPAPLQPPWVLQRAKRVACRRQTRRYAEAPSAGISYHFCLHLHQCGARWWCHSFVQWNAQLRIFRFVLKTIKTREDLSPYFKLRVALQSQTKPWPHHFHIIAVHATMGGVLICLICLALSSYHFKSYMTRMISLLLANIVHIPGHITIAYQSCMPRHAKCFHFQKINKLFKCICMCCILCWKIFLFLCLPVCNWSSYCLFSIACVSGTVVTG